jgi:polynucleotide 5'-kinase involved in rRNA processing
VVLNLVLTLFCQDLEEWEETWDGNLRDNREGKAESNRIPIMLIGQDRGGKTSLMRRHLRLPLNSFTMLMPVAL